MISSNGFFSPGQCNVNGAIINALLIAIPLEEIMVAYVFTRVLSVTQVFR